MTPTKQRIADRDSRLFQWVMEGKDTKSFAYDNDITPSYACTILGRMNVRMIWTTPEERENLMALREDSNVPGSL